jgi:hypothetical protein
MEMIYEDPAALESINDTQSTFKRSTSATKANKVTKKNTKVSKKRAANTVVMQNVYEECSSDDFSEEDDFNMYRPTCHYANSVTSTQTVPDFYFDSPNATSPSTDCYSESDMQSPYAESSTNFVFQLSYPTMTTASSESLSPYSVLDSPLLNDSNAYSPMSLEAQMDYFQFDPSTIITNTFDNKYTQEFGWNGCPDYYLTQQCQDFIMMQMSQPVQYIDPSLLHM